MPQTFLQHSIVMSIKIIIESFNELYVWEHFFYKNYTKLKSKPHLMSRSHFVVNVKSMENSDIYDHQSLAFSTVSITAFCSFCLGWDSFFFFFLKSLEKVDSPMQVEILWPRFQKADAKLFGVVIYPDGLPFCISANVITKYNNFSSKVIRAYLAPSLICPTCYLLITLWGDLVVLLLLRAKWPRG